MKKIIAFVLTVAMLATFSVTAFAEDTNDGTTPTSIEVNADFKAGAEAGVCISADISWEEMSFTYTEGDKGEWIPSEHEYAEDETGYWSTEKKRITVDNHSNTAITAALSFTPSANGVVGSFTEDSGTENDSILALASADEEEALGDITKAPTASAYFGISGGAITETGAIGTITVRISKA